MLREREMKIKTVEIKKNERALCTHFRSCFGLFQTNKKRVLFYSVKQLVCTGTLLEKGKM